MLPVIRPQQISFLAAFPPKVCFVEVLGEQGLGSGGAIDEFNLALAKIEPANHEPQRAIGQEVTHFNERFHCQS